MIWSTGEETEIHVIVDGIAWFLYDDGFFRENFTVKEIEVSKLDDEIMISYLVGHYYKDTVD